MITCPHCQQRGVPVLPARFSDPSLAVSCRLCAGLSHRAAGDASPVINILLVFAVIMAGIMSGSWLLALTGMAGVLAWNIWSWQRLELLPLSAGRAALAKKTGLALDAIWILAWLWR